MKLFITAISMLTVSAVCAQNITGGVKGGVNISNFTGGDFNDVKKTALVGFHAGGYLNFALGGVSIQPEVLVSTGGATLEDQGNKVDVKLTYISVPVMVKFNPGGGFYLEAGPQVGFKISEDVKNQTVGDFAKSLDLSAGAGLGYSFGKLGIGGRYLVGLSKVGDFDSGNVDPDFKNSTIQVGLFLKLGK